MALQLFRHLNFRLAPYTLSVNSKKGSLLYFGKSEISGNHRIRLITPVGVISTIASTGVAGFSGDGAAATSAQLNSPTGVYVSDGLIYIADQGNHRIRLISGTTITTFAGKDSSGFSGDGGAATSAKLSSPTDVYADTAGNLYITDSGNHRARLPSYWSRPQSIPRRHLHRIQGG